MEGCLEREKIISHEKNFKHRKIILLINFFFDPTSFLIASYRILKNYAILINYKSVFQEKDSLHLNHFQFSKMNKLHRSANNGFVFVVGKRKIVSGIIYDVESESGIRISLSRQDFEIFEVMCSKNGVFRYFRGYVQGARNFFGFFLTCHHLALLFPFKMSY